MDVSVDTLVPCLKSLSDVECVKRVQHPWALLLKTVHFLKKIKQFWTKYPIWIWLEMFQGTRKSQFCLSRPLL